jgi:hypothetical protein
MAKNGEKVEYHKDDDPTWQEMVKKVEKGSCWTSTRS